MPASLHEQSPMYRGRFAPSPSGPLHFGSLACAVASFLQARSRGGYWMLRMEDLDPPREVPGASDDILRTLEHYQLYWDGPVVYQSRLRERYEHWLAHLSQQGLVYHCRCSRKQIRKQQGELDIVIYPGTCRERHLAPSAGRAVRLTTPHTTVAFEDRIQGPYQQQLATDVGDFVLRRADGWFAYQFAVVVDDAAQQITEVVRGSDLLDNTPRQILLQQLLGLGTPQYAHIPLATDQNGDKLSKQTGAAPISRYHPLRTALLILDFLGQQPPAETQFDTLQTLWQWAIENWQLARIPKTMGIMVDH